MNFLIHQIFHSKRPNISPKFISSLSLATIENPSPKSSENAALCHNIDPHQIFSEWKKSSIVTVSDAAVLHAHLMKTAALWSDVFLCNSLMDCYWNLSAADNALQLFDEMPSPNSTSWNVMILGHIQNHLFDGAWRCFCQMRSVGCESNQYTYGSVISACAGLGSLLYGKMIYSLSIKNGLFTDGYIRSGMIDLFAKNGCFEDALQVFNDWPYEENVVCWNSVISRAVKSGCNGMAIELFNQMRLLSVIPNSFTLSSVCTACISLKDIDMGKKVHGLVIKHGATEDVFIGTSIVDLYAKCGDMNEAAKNFLRMRVHNVVSWTAMISGYVQKGDVISAIKLFNKMRKLGIEVNNYTITSIFSACAKFLMTDVALQMHSWILKSGFSVESTVAAALINTYSKMGEVGLSESLYLEQEGSKEIGVWSVMTSSFAQNHRLDKASELFQKMLLKDLRPDNFSISSILSIIDCLDVGRQFHAFTLKTGLVFDLSVGSSLFTMYSKCNCLAESYGIFLQLPYKDIVSWASMISGFAEHGYADKAIQLFREMLHMESRSDQTTLVGVLTACSSHGILSIGKEIHGYAFRAGISGENLIGGALVNMYSKCGATYSARRVFDMIPHKDKVLCSALVSGYAQKGKIEEALSVLHEMLAIDQEINPYMLSSILGSEALLNRTDTGIQLHALVTKLGLHSDVSVGSSLITMYSKRGVIDDCRKAFDQITKPDLIGWTTMILGYAQHGKATEALRLYEAMKNEGIRPDSITFVGVLSACSHNGLVDEGYFHLNSMSKCYGIEPGLRHYACMVDLLGRSGRLKEAEKFIRDMPIGPDALVWGTLLSACKVHGDAELGRVVAEKIFYLEPSDSGAYISWSNILADMGLWKEVEQIRSRMKGTRLSKEPGWSHEHINVIKDRFAEICPLISHA
ncbi:hypothetical protein Cgig2_006144 [Carnegiea gigantea]|uniref:Chlororespiratory reduction 21 n=1 Tax=Carnegiea gigantea TaxID=171969 RepID=A0A9Q1QSB9_9CARY|nr:hypothetical protein Cgig2_006144 [Carnegiea gigantea]